MLQLILRIVRWLRGGTLKLLVLAGVILLIWGVTSPVGTLVWWAERGAETLGFQAPPQDLTPQKGASAIPKSSNTNCYIVFLPGVGDFSADELTPGEETFLNGLEQRHPSCVTVSDVFPYSAANRSLGGQRLLAPLWRFANQAEGWWGVASVLIQIRNLWRFAISADPRYGTIYNQGIAAAIIERMNEMYPLSQVQGQPWKIILIGTSGGVQVALGAAPYLDKWLDAELTIVSVGGVFYGKEGFNSIESFYHLRGQRDWIENIGGIIFPSRWLWNVGSQFNQARRQTEYTSLTSGPHAHQGPEGYFGEQRIEGKDRTYVGLTLEVVNQLPIWPQTHRGD